MSSRKKVDAYKKIFSEIEEVLDETDWKEENIDAFNAKLFPFWKRFVHSILIKEGKCGCVDPSPEKRCFAELDKSNQLSSRAWGDGGFVSFSEFKQGIRFMWNNVKKYELDE
jgi:hypothetical protein